MDAEDARKWAQRLSEAAETRMPIEPITSQIPGLSVRDAYTIQTEWTGLKLAAGDSVVGYKLGRVPRLEASWWPIGRLPARRLAIPPTVPGCGVEP